MKVLVTGANGYLGRGIVKKLLDSGNEVIAVDFTVDMVDKRAVRCAYDLFAVRVTKEEELIPALETAINHNGTAIIDIVIDSFENI